MSEAPTLIILAESESRHMTDGPHLAPAMSAHNSMTALDTVHHTIRKGLASGLQVLLVAPPMVAAQAHHLLPADRVILLPEPQAPSLSGGNDQMALGVAIAVIASARSPGWLLLPGDMPLLQAETLKIMGQAVTQESLVFPEYRHRRGHPVGFSAEFYSELIRLQRERDLQRLLAQYPAHGIEVDDAGILMTQDPHSNLALLRTVLQGHAGLHVQH
ncbi:MAG: NTP transferase domain-containing protein [Aquabacterium sp.]|jgi:molybdenum cofactor cytidylyltransferase|nr:NTP transferase domain-containing protein [Aquabacterium sp.]MDX9842853.1 NTP transferase domain-containing protein [Aquabacterium sp.]